MTRKSICVYCGARTGRREAYLKAAETFGRLMAEEGWRLVYGAGDVGLMGAVARSAQAAGGETFGVIPQHLVAWEVGKTDLTSYVVTETMHERKKVMFMNCQAVVVLPGGAGSLDELFEVITWRQLGLHEKPIILMNTEGYWEPLLALLHHVTTEGFAAKTLHEFYEIVPDPETVMDRLRGHLA